jgi:putative DNA primase/helicase
MVGRLHRFLPWVARPRPGSPDRVSKVPARRLGRKLYPTRPDEPAAWLSLEAAQAEVAEGHADGIGMCLPDGLGVVDIDHVLHDGNLNAETRQLVERSRTWTEVSPSSTGLHLWFSTDAPLRSGRAGGLELLAAGRFITVSRRDLPGTVRTIATLPDELSVLFMPAERERPALRECQSVQPRGDPDAAFAEALRRSAKLRNLFLGTSTAGYPSSSECDLALLQQIHRWVGPDPARLDAIFKRSGIYRRERWENVAYRERTLALVLRSGRWSP